jgi:hypothetical protein
MMSDFSDERLRALYSAHAANAPDTPHPDPDQLADAALGRGAEPARLAVFDHALSCAACRRELDVLRATSDAGRLVQRHHRTIRACLAIAAVIVVAIAVPSIMRRSVRQFRPAEPSDTERGATTDTAPRAIGIIGPAGTIAPGARPLFVWHRAPGAASYLLEIVNDSGLVVDRSRTPDTTLPWPALPAGGRYRWRVIATETGGVRWESVFTDLVVLKQ